MNGNNAIQSKPMSATMKSLDQGRESSRAAIKSMEEAKALAITSATELDAQGKRIEKMSAKMDEMNQDLHTSEKYLRSISSWFGSLWNSVGPNSPAKPISVPEPAPSKNRSFPSTSTGSSGAIKSPTLSSDIISSLSAEERQAYEESEKNLDELMESLQVIKGLSANIGSTVEKQTHDINALSAKVDHNTAKIKTQNRKISKLM
jgi:hypothetical protein